MRRVEVAPSVVNGHIEGLKHNNILIPYLRHDIQTKVIPGGIISFNLVNLFPSTISKRVVVCFVTNTAYNGSYKTNPYNFQHFKLTSISLKIDGASVPYAKALSCKNWAADSRDTLEYYYAFLESMNLTNVNEAPGIDYKMFRNGFFFIVFNLSPDLEITNPASPNTTGSVELEMIWIGFV